MVPESRIAGTMATFRAATIERHEEPAIRSRVPRRARPRHRDPGGDAAHGVEPARIAKTLSLRLGDDVILVVMGGEARLDNRKYKDRFAAKAKMLDADEVLAATSHPVGGVCPFGLPRPLRVYADLSLRQFDVVVPAGGDTHHALRISPGRLVELAGAEWIDVAQAPAAAP